ncbi:MAG: hypothetical protein QG671_1520 [Actinomycetota bacterium]|nr:hypothetical protein [Actinomycetota bacterium]
MESITPGATLDPTGLLFTSISRCEVANAVGTQPSQRTVAEFTSDSRTGLDPDVLAARLSRVLDPSGWYVDFHDNDAHREVDEYARSVGVPHPQTDWGR